MEKMRTILYLGKSYCLSLNDLKELFRKSTSSASLYEELLSSFRDGTLVDWLYEGNTTEQNIADEIALISSSMPNSEVMRRMQKIFTNEHLASPGPDFREFLQLSSCKYKILEKEGDLQPVLLDGKCNLINLDSDEIKETKVIIRLIFDVNRIDNEKFFFRLFVDDVETECTDVSMINLRKGEPHVIDWSFIVKDKNPHVVKVSCGSEIINEFKFQRSFVYSIDNGVMTVRPFKDKKYSFKMILVEGGTFMMGYKKVTSPVHHVTLDSFYIGEVPVTNELWKYVMNNNPSPTTCEDPDKPVVRVSWIDCQEFIKKLNELTRLNFRLPTEAEWEYAARDRGNGDTKYAGSDNINDVAWFTGNSGYRIHDVARKKPNGLGIYDMSGNVWEWCQDWYDSYSSNSQKNPQGPSSGSFRVFRGGCWFYDARLCRVSYRHFNTPGYRNSNLGLRLAL